MVELEKKGLGSRDGEGVHTLAKQRWASGKMGSETRATLGLDISGNIDETKYGPRLQTLATQRSKVN